jgi:hypothetical protein
MADAESFDAQSSALSISHDELEARALKTVAVTERDLHQRIDHRGRTSGG